MSVLQKVLTINYLKQINTYFRTQITTLSMFTNLKNIFLPKAGRLSYLEPPLPHFQ